MRQTRNVWANILGKLKKQAVRAGDIVRRTRGFVRKTAPHRRLCHVIDLLTDVVGLLEPEARQGVVRFDLRLDKKTPNVLIDEVQIQQVLVNLVRNALDAMTHSNVELKQVIITASQSNRGFVEVAVEDSGAGITAAEVEQVFDPFFTTKPKGMGTGLAIRRSIIEEHGGRLWAERGRTKGAVFRFTLPSAADGDPTLDDSTKHIRD